MKAPATTEISGHIARSPMVDTFYRTLNLDARAFTEIEQEVNAGDTLCIAEAMEMMSQVGADKSGIVRIILIEGDQPTEFDKPLVIIE